MNRDRRPDYSSLLTGLEAWWPWIGISGADIIGSNSMSTNTLTATCPGKFGPAPIFNGETYANIASNAHISFGDEDFTFGGWVRINDIAKNYGIFCKEPANVSDIGTEYSLAFRASTDERWRFTVSDGSTHRELAFTNGPIPIPGSWYPIMCERDATNDTVTISSGILRRSQSYTGTGPNPTVSSLKFGRTVAYSAGFSVQGWGLWRRLLTDQEKNLLWNYGAGLHYPSGVTVSRSVVGSSDPLTLSIGTPTQLSIPTYDGTGQAVHPSVVYIPGGFAGYTYWMAMTPYYHGTDSRENPSLVASNDGNTWLVPEGIVNPIVAAPGGAAHNSDPELIYDGSQLICYYRRNESGVSDVLYRKTISSALIVGEEVEILNFGLLSPAIVRNSAADWWLWGATSDNIIHRFRSSDGDNWLYDGINALIGPYILPWHLSVSADATGYHMLIAAYPRASNNAHTSLYYARLGAPQSRINIGEPILGASTGWASRQIYRSCYSNGRVYISAADSASNWYIGYV